MKIENRNGRLTVVDPSGHGQVDGANREELNKKLPAFGPTTLKKGGPGPTQMGDNPPNDSGTR
jgi:hypothetical protein